MSDRQRKAGLAIIIALYLGLGTAFALKTPIWQAPDEPAHFNYVKNIAEGKGLPILTEGDYDFAYLEKLKSAKFPKDMSVENLRYESHQPPLYYTLAAPLYLATSFLPLSNQVISLRFFSLLFGCLLLLIAYAVVRQIFPGDNVFALGIPAFIATLPQHIAISAAINNDTLAGVILSAILLLLIRRLKATEGRLPLRPTLLLGILLGLALLTKTTAYIALILVPLAMFLRTKERGATLRQLLIICLIVAAISGWWFVRNTIVYGDADLLGLQRHDMVMSEQPRTSTLDMATARHFAIVTFKSFWVQLGWMAVPANEQIYTVMGSISAVASLGLLLFFLRAITNHEALPKGQGFPMLLLIVTLLLTFLGMFSYNLQFIQAQGRYLFPALIPIGLFFLLGLREILSPRYFPLLMALLFGGLFLLDLYALTRLVPLLS